MSRFKERLWRDLVREHGAELAAISSPPRQARRPRPRVLAGTTAGLATVATAVALLVGAASSSPAFAVTQSRDGTVSVVIKQFGAIHVVNERLAKLGLRARFVVAAAGCAPPDALVHWLASHKGQVGSVTVTRGFLSARLDPKKIPAGQVLIVPAWRDGHAVKVSPGRLVPGAPPACLPVPAFLGAARAQLPGTVHCLVAAGQVRATAVPAPAGNSGNSGAPPAGNSGNSGAPTGNSGPFTQVVPPGAGNGNSGAPPPGNSGNSSPPQTQAVPPSGSKLPKLACPAWAHVQAQKALAAAKRAKSQKH